MSELSKEALADSLRDITKQHQSTIDSCIQTLTHIKESKKITESSFRELSSVVAELDILKDVFISRLWNALKRGDLI